MPKAEWVSGPNRRFVLAPQDVDGLEDKVMSFTNMPRADAEEKAYGDYRREHHIRAAAHHLQGMRAAQAAGEYSQAMRHKLVYDMHLKSVGMKDDGKVPDEIANHLVDPEREPGYKFKAHKGDAFLLNKNEDGEYEILTKKEATTGCPHCGSVLTSVVQNGYHCGSCKKVFQRFKVIQGGGENPDGGKPNLKVVKDEAPAESFAFSENDARKVLKSLVKAAMKFKQVSEKPYTGRDEGIRRSKLPPGAPGADKAGVGVQDDKKKKAAKEAARKWRPGKDD